MAGKSKVAEYEERIEFYHKLGKQRALEEHELERLEWLVRRVKDSKRERAYRERHKERIKEREQQRRYTKKGAVRKAYKIKEKKASKRRREQHPAKYRALSAEWRRNNPEKYAALRQEYNERRRNLKETDPEAYRIMLDKNNESKRRCRARRQKATVTENSYLPNRRDSANHRGQPGFPDPVPVVTVEGY
jgi:hypothetical protein